MRAFAGGGQAARECVTAGRRAWPHRVAGWGRAGGRSADCLAGRALSHARRSAERTLAAATARGPASHDDPQRAARLAAEQIWTREYRDTLVDRLARLCGRPMDDLWVEQSNIQKRVRTIVESVNRASYRRIAGQRHDPPTAGLPGATAPLWQKLLTEAAGAPAPDDPRTAPRIIVAEEVDYHVLVPDVPLEVIAEVESHPDRYPGVRIVEQSCRHYPRGCSRRMSSGTWAWRMKPSAGKIRIRSPRPRQIRPANKNREWRKASSVAWASTAVSRSIARARRRAHRSYRSWRPVVIEHSPGRTGGRRRRGADARRPIATTGRRRSDRTLALADRADAA